MQLAIETKIRKSIITVEIETVNFTKIENDLLDQFGEFVYNLETLYQGEFAVAIHKKIRSNFKIRIKFDGSASEDAMERATAAANEFIEQVQEEIEDQYNEWLFEKQQLLEELEGGLGKTAVDITDKSFRSPRPLKPYRGGYRPYIHN